MKIKRRPLLVTTLSVVATLFGIATLKEGGSVLFSEVDKQNAGNFVPFVLWFNFFAGFAYILAGKMLFRLENSARKFSSIIAMATTIVFIFFGIHILNGGAYELRTVFAMTLRSGIWIAIAFFASKSDALKPKVSKR